MRSNWHAKLLNSQHYRDADTAMLSCFKQLWFFEIWNSTVFKVDTEKLQKCETKRLVLCHWNEFAGMAIVLQVISAIGWRKLLEALWPYRQFSTDESQGCKKFPVKTSWFVSSVKVCVRLKMELGFRLRSKGPLLNYNGRTIFVKQKGHAMRETVLFRRSPLEVS